MIPNTIDRYLLRRTLTPMSAVLVSTMVMFLMERLMRSFQVLSQTTEGFRFLMELLVNLVPHYVGLTLPGGFFIGLFVVVNGLNKSSEIDAILASGVSLDRFASPFVALGAALMVFSIVLFGFVQPYSRYAYHAVLHAVANAGWNGDVRPKALLSAGKDILLTADAADASGRHLQQIFIRQFGPDGREDVLTAASAEVLKAPGETKATLVLRDGRQVSTTPLSEVYVADFTRFRFDLPVAQAKSLRIRGDKVSELTLLELAQQGFGKATPALPRQALLAELFTRSSRALILPLLPLMAVPFALSAKRAGAGSAMVIGGVLLFLFETSLVLGQALTTATGFSALATVGVPAGLFAAACVAVWISSRNRPGENPVNWLSQTVAERFAALVKKQRPRAA